MNRRESIQDVRIPINGISLDGDLRMPEDPLGIVVFARGSGSSRFSSRNKAVAEIIRDMGVGTLLFDLLTKEEESVDIYTRHLRFDISLLAERLIAVVDWLNVQEITAALPVGLFGASTGGAAALAAAAKLGERINVIVSRGGRPDLAGDALPLVKAPTLLIVGELDDVVIELNRSAMARMRCQTELKIVSGATHLFEEPGALDLVANLAGEWFFEHLKPEAKTANA
jgi:putative phosphoribosyl transferase